MADLPKPLTPPDCNLRDFPRMMIHIGRLRGSSFDAVFDDGAWRAGVNLWMSSWHNVPAGSLEASEAELTKAAGLGRDVRTWRKVRDDAMRGWELCDDGLYYHEVVAETVLDAWLTKLVQRLSSGFGNFKRHGTPFDASAVTADIRVAAALLANLDPKAEALAKTSIKKALAGIPPDVPPGEGVVPSGDQREGVNSRRGRKGREEKNTPKPPRGASVELKEWKGPADVLEALLRAKHGDTAWALRWLGHCRYQDLPCKALVTASGTAFDKLTGEAEAALGAIGVRVIHEAAA